MCVCDMYNETVLFHCSFKKPIKNGGIATVYIKWKLRAFIGYILNDIVY